MSIYMVFPGHFFLCLNVFKIYNDATEQSSCQVYNNDIKTISTTSILYLYY